MTRARDVADASLAHIATQTFSAASAVNVNNVFSSDYENYKLILDITGLTTSASLRYRMRVSGSDDSGSNYEYTEFFLDPTTSATRQLSQTSGRLFVGAGTSSFVSSSDIYKPFLNDRTSFITEYGLGFFAGFVSNSHTPSQSYTGFSIFPSSGTIGGTLSVYGYRKS